MTGEQGQRWERLAAMAQEMHPNSTLAGAAKWGLLLAVHAEMEALQQRVRSLEDAGAEIAYNEAEELVAVIAQRDRIAAENEALKARVAELEARLEDQPTFAEMLQDAQEEK